MSGATSASYSLNAEALVAICGLPKSLVAALLRTPKYSNKDEGAVVDALLELREALSPLDPSVVAAIVGDGCSDGGAAEDMLRRLATETLQSHEREKLIAASRRHEQYANAAAIYSNDVGARAHEYPGHEDYGVTRPRYNPKQNHHHSAAAAFDQSTAARSGAESRAPREFHQPQHAPIAAGGASTGGSDTSAMPHGANNSVTHGAYVASVPSSYVRVPSPSDGIRNSLDGSRVHVETSTEDARGDMGHESRSDHQQANETPSPNSASGKERGGLLSWFLKGWSTDKKHKKGAHFEEGNKASATPSNVPHSPTQSEASTEEVSKPPETHEKVDEEGTTNDNVHDADTNNIGGMPMLTSEVRRMFGEAERGKSAPSFGVKPIRPQPGMFGYVDECEATCSSSYSNGMLAHTSPSYPTSAIAANGTPRKQGTIRGASPRSPLGAGGAKKDASFSLSRVAADEPTGLGGSLSSSFQAAPAGAPTVCFGPSGDSSVSFGRGSISGRYKPAVSVSISPFDAPQRYEAVVEVSEEDAEGNIPSEVLDDYGRPVKVVKTTGGSLLSVAPSALAPSTAPATALSSVIGTHDDVNFDALFSKFVEEGKRK